MNMTNTTPGISARTKVAKHTTWQEIVPFLRTGDIVTVYFREGEPERSAKVWVSNKTLLITAGERTLRWPDGTLNSRVTDIVLQYARGRAEDLVPLAKSLKAGDVVRATFVVSQSAFRKSHAITLEGTVDACRNGDTFLAVEDEGGGTPEFCYFTSYGRVPLRLRALEVIDRADDTKGAGISAERDAELRKLAASLKDGDVVRAAFIDRNTAGDDLIITREGPVMLDADGDPFLLQGGELYHLTWYGAPVRDLRALEVIDPDEDADMGLPPEPEPLPVNQVRLQPGSGYAWQKLPHGWECAQLSNYLDDDDVRSWPVMEIIAGDDKDIEEIIEDITGEECAEPEDAAPLTFAAYAARATETAVYPGAGTFWGLQYVTAGLSSEAGEVIGKVSKMQRDGGYTPESSTFWGGDRADLVAELGDVAWYLAMACREADIDPNEVLRRNLSKLADRAARDTIQGSGDNR